MIRIFRTGDILDIFRIEQQNPDTQIFTKKELNTLLDNPVVQCYVAESGQQIVGYMIYTWTKKYYHVISIKILPEFKRKKYGRYLIEKIKERLCDSGRNRIICYVDETNLEACNFFKRLKFRAFTKQEDCIVFKYCRAFDFIGDKNVE